MFLEVPTTDFGVWVIDYMCGVEAPGYISCLRHLGPMSLPQGIPEENPSGCDTERK